MTYLVRRHLLTVLVVAALALLVLAPIAGVVYGSFWSQSPIRPGGFFTIRNWPDVLTRTSFVNALAGTLVLSALVTPLSVGLGAMFALLIGRTDAYGRRFIEACLYLTLMVSPFILATAWISLASPDAGLLNYLPQKLWGASLFNIYTVSGVVFVMVTFFAPFVYAMVLPAMRSIDVQLDEAAAVCGARGAARLSTVVLPVLRPVMVGSAVLVLVLSLEMFSVPALIGAPAGIQTLSYEMYRYIRISPSSWQASAVIGCFLLLLTLLVLALQRYVVGDVRRYRTVSGRERAQRPIELGRLRIPLSLLGIAYVTVTIILPIIALFVGAFSRYAAGLEISAETFTIENFSTVLSSSQFFTAMSNSAIVMTFGAALTTLLCLATLISAYSLAPSRVGAALDLVIKAPVALPGVVLGLGLLWLYLSNPLPIYGTLAIVMIGVITRYLPQVYNALLGSYVQIGSELREAAAVSGAQTGNVILDIDLPLMRRAMLSAYLLAAILIVGEVNTTVMVYSNTSLTLPTLLWDVLSGSGNITTAYVIAVIQLVLTSAIIALTAWIGAAGNLRAAPR
jgi:iron(III) transport system permease protein